MMVAKYFCAYCEAEITSPHGRSRAKARGYGYCSQSCEAAVKTRRAYENLSMRVLSRVDMREDDECWPFKGRLSHGYGVVDFSGRPVLAHRIVFQIIKHIDPSGLVVCHSCDNPRCCNPGHLWLGTQADNMADMWAKGRGKVSTENLRRGERR